MTSRFFPFYTFDFIISACSGCHELIQREVHNLRESIHALKLMINNSLEGDQILLQPTFVTSIENITVLVMKLIGNAQMYSLKEENIIKDLRNLNSTLDDLHTVMKVNISDEIALIRAKIPTPYNTVNESLGIVDTIYSLLWTSVYVLNADIQPTVEGYRNRLNELNFILSNMANISQHQKSQYTPVLTDMSFLINTTAKLLNKTYFLQNQKNNLTDLGSKASDDIEDLSSAVTGAKVVIENLFNSSSYFMNMTVKALKDVNEAFNDTFNKTTFNITKKIAKIQSNMKNIEEEITKLKATEQQISGKEKNVLVGATLFMNTSGELKDNLGVILSQSAYVYGVVLNASQRKDSAISSVNNTFLEANQILEIVANFDQVSNNASILASRSLDFLREV